MYGFLFAFHFHRNHNLYGSIIFSRFDTKGLQEHMHGQTPSYSDRQTPHDGKNSDDFL